MNRMGFSWLCLNHSGFVVKSLDNLLRSIAILFICNLHDLIFNVRFTHFGISIEENWKLPSMFLDNYNFNHLDDSLHELLLLLAVLDDLRETDVVILKHKFNTISVWNLLCPDNEIIHSYRRLLNRAILAVDSKQLIKMRFDTFKTVVLWYWKLKGNANHPHITNGWHIGNFRFICKFCKFHGVRSILASFPLPVKGEGNLHP